MSKWEGAVLSAENRCLFFVLCGFAHGFLVLSETVDFFYKRDDTYHPDDEGCLMWNGPVIGIEWTALDDSETFNEFDVVLSDKDKVYPRFNSNLCIR